MIENEGRGRYVLMREGGLKTKLPHHRVATPSRRKFALHQLDACRRPRTERPKRRPIEEVRDFSRFGKTELLPDPRQGDMSRKPCLGGFWSELQCGRGDSLVEQEQTISRVVNPSPDYPRRAQPGKTSEPFADEFDVAKVPRRFRQGFAEGLNVRWRNIAQKSQREVHALRARP